MNAYAERFVLSVKSECLDRIVPLGEAHLRRAIREYLVHYHAASAAIRVLATCCSRELRRRPTRTLRFNRRERLGGLLNYYHRRA